MRAFSRITIGAFSLVSMAAGAVAPARANDGASAANACPYEMAVTVALGRQSLTIPQSALAESSTDVDGFELRPDHTRLVLEITSRRGEVWYAPMTKLVQGKRCKGIFLGRPEQAAAHDD